MANLVHRTEHPPGPGIGWPLLSISYHLLLSLSLRSENCYLLASNFFECTAPPVTTPYLNANVQTDTNCERWHTLAIVSWQSATPSHSFTVRLFFVSVSSASNMSFLHFQGSAHSHLSCTVCELLVGRKRLSLLEEICTPSLCMPVNRDTHTDGPMVQFSWWTGVRLATYSLTGCTVTCRNPQSQTAGWGG